MVYRRTNVWNVCDSHVSSKQMDFQWMHQNVLGFIKNIYIFIIKSVLWRNKSLKSLEDMSKWSQNSIFWTYHSFYEHDNNCLDINKYAMYEGVTLNI